MAKSVLGRGLASLIPGQAEAAPAVAPLRRDDGVTDRMIAHIPLDHIERNPYQPRADFDPASLDELARSIREKGVIQPITVRRHGEAYQLISGERRVRAARDAGLTHIPAYIIRVATDEEMLELALIENLQREHLNPIEIAISYRRLIEECQFTQEEVARRIGKDRTTVTNSLRLLKLPEEIQNALRHNTLTSGHARALIAIENEAMQLHLFHRITRDELSVREVERLVRGKAQRRPSRPSPAAATSAHLSNVEERIRRVLGTKVTVRPLQNGRGEIVLEYYSADDLSRLVELVEELERR
ncbi:MAG: parB-like partition protein [Bacteroidetes bacterium]|nr:parB-like partition protein [Bacteroidota bacterium]MBP1679228.1 parB-like partition protein [Bacteroidota bacterium]